MIGLYHPGRSLLHRTPAGPKLLLLAVAVVLTVRLDTPVQLGVALLAVAVLFAVAGIPARVALAQFRPLLWIVPFIAAFQLLFSGWERAVTSVGTLLVNVGLAALVTLTTRVSAMLDLTRTLLRPLRRVGVDPDRIGLMLALTIRCVPLVSGIVGDVVQARKARGVTGLRNSALALAAPAVVRALRTADSLGDALRARGVDD
ncbi:energy-coupling factor transporter transmembrane component T family protein [Nakamurella deserti]|uniref:energy-coupling factor transporter transmembrane component T family protein n=1 Tax=Nakamurella deserti TaxID=2164074 RepID=UPI000DBE1DC9|nr:energy-coupling factor transporter transmembrane protein EcfT [Nakamurella deserti]